MIRIGLFLGFVILFLMRGQAQHQEWHLQAAVQVEDLDQISIDNQGNVFYADESGNVVKMDPKGTKISEYSPVFQTKLDQLEAFFTMNIFLFSADLQQLVLLDVFLNPLTTVSIQKDEIGIVRAATLGNNHAIWMFDEVDLSLVRYDYRRSLILQDQPLSLILDKEKLKILEIAERQNMVFLNIENQGIFIFDIQGNFLNKLTVHIKQKLSLHGDFIYFIQEGSIHRINFYSGKKDTFPLPNGSFKNILVSPEKIIFYSTSWIHFYNHPIFE